MHNIPKMWGLRVQKCVDCNNYPFLFSWFTQTTKIFLQQKFPDLRYFQDVRTLDRFLIFPCVVMSEFGLDSELDRIMMVLKDLLPVYLIGL